MSSPKLAKRSSGYREAAKDLQRNKPQWAAYESSGNCVVLAGPGSGKTKVLTAKLARMLAEEVAAPRGIACMTYSTECARELTRRLASLGVRSSHRLFVGTVHSFCLKAIVRPYSRLAGIDVPDPIRIASQSSCNSAFTKALASIKGVNENPAQWRTRCDSYRRTLLDRTTDQWREHDSDAAQVIEQYERLLHTSGAIDFDDMMLIGLRLVQQYQWVRKALRARYPILVVDEYQDLGVPLHHLVMSLCFHASESNARLLAVGDPDQSIYGFTGAQPALLKDLAERKDVAKVSLQLNYRSRAELVAGGEAALGEKRNYSSASGDGGVIDFHLCRDGLEQQAEAICREWIPSVLGSGAARTLGDIAVLYSSKYIGDPIASAASQAGLPFIRVDQNAAYPKTPVTRWLESSAAWCAGGWSDGDPPLSDILARWLVLNARLTSSTAQQESRRKIVRFLFDHRDTAVPLLNWLSALEESCLGETFDLEPDLLDEKEVFGKLKAATAAGKALSKWTVGTFGGQGGSADNLNLMTFHSSKGLEFDVVFMLGMDDGIEPPWFTKSSDGIMERRRLFFVGFTRARNEVHLMYSGWTLTKNGYRRNDGPSRFLLELKKRLGLK